MVSKILEEMIKNQEITNNSIAPMGCIVLNNERIFFKRVINLSISNQKSPPPPVRRVDVRNLRTGLGADMQIWVTDELW